jgi:hypothetical protein
MRAGVEMIRNSPGPQAAKSRRAQLNIGMHCYMHDTSTRLGKPPRTCAGLDPKSAHFTAGC